MRANLLIDHQCPQCGGPATLTETDRLFSCGFCRVRSYLMPGDHFRYVLPSRAPSDKELIYFPYWRIKGLLFSVVDAGVRQRFIDVSHQAQVSIYFPHSLGFRSQTQKLRFLSTDHPGTFLQPTLSLERTFEIFRERFAADLPQPIYHMSHIGDHMSLIYAPYYCERKLYDAVLDEPLVRSLPEDIQESVAGGGGRPDWRLEFLPTLCPDCGWDLEGERDALVLLCRNCNTAWHPQRGGLHRLRFGHLPGNGKETLFLPFWRIRADVGGVELGSYADLVRVANLPRVVQDGWRDIPFRFWTPGFKIRPQTFLSLSSKLTLSQPRRPLVKELPRGDLHPVTLPLEEALESLKVTLANFVKPRSNYYPRLAEIAVEPHSFLLVYLPFQVHPHELIQDDLKLVLLKNQLNLAKNL
jgi:hypothetical protein